MFDYVHDFIQYCTFAFSYHVMFKMLSCPDRQQPLHDEVKWILLQLDIQLVGLCFLTTVVYEIGLSNCFFGLDFVF